MGEGPLRWQVVRGHGAHLSLGQHRHGLDPGQRPSRRPGALEAEHRPSPALDAPVVLLDRVVEPPPAPVPDESPQPALALHLPERAGVALEPVGDDGPRIAGVLAGERLAEEALAARLSRLALSKVKSIVCPVPSTAR